MYRYAVCLASYGFMGDLMKRSESMRWMGPVRYEFAGAFTFVSGKPSLYFNSLFLFTTHL